MSVEPVTAFIQGIGGGEILVIFVLFLMLFGAKKLPGIARSLGKSVSEFQRAAREVREEFLNADRELNKPSTPVVDTPAVPGGSDGSDGSGGSDGSDGADGYGGGLADAVGPEMEPVGGPIEPVRESVPEPAVEAPAAVAGPDMPAPDAAPETVPDAPASQPAVDVNPGHVEVQKP